MYWSQQQIEHLGGYYSLEQPDNPADYVPDHVCETYGLVATVHCRCSGERTVSSGETVVSELVVAPVVSVVSRYIFRALGHLESDRLIN